MMQMLLMPMLSRLLRRCASAGWGHGLRRSLIACSLGFGPHPLLLACLALLHLLLHLPAHSHMHPHHSPHALGVASQPPLPLRMVSPPPPLVSLASRASSSLGTVCPPHGHPSWPLGACNPSLFLTMMSLAVWDPSPFRTVMSLAGRLCGLLLHVAAGLLADAVAAVTIRTSLSLATLLHEWAHLAAASLLLRKLSRTSTSTRTLTRTRTRTHTRTRTRTHTRTRTYTRTLARRTHGSARHHGRRTLVRRTHQDGIAGHGRGRKHGWQHRRGAEGGRERELPAEGLPPQVPSVRIPCRSHSRVPPQVWTASNLMAHTTLWDWMASINPLRRIPPSFRPHVLIPRSDAMGHGSLPARSGAGRGERILAEAVTRHAGWLFSLLLAALSVLASSDYLFPAAPSRPTWSSGGSNSAFSHHSPHRVPPSSHQPEWLSSEWRLTEWLPTALDVRMRVEDAVLGVVLCAVCAISTDLLGFTFGAASATDTPPQRSSDLASKQNASSPSSTSVAAFFCGNFGCLLSASADGSR